MKKILAIVSVILLVLTSCQSGDILGGRYYGTFNNMTNNMREMGSLSFKYANKGGETYFLMNDLDTPKPLRPLRSCRIGEDGRPEVTWIQGTG